MECQYILLYIYISIWGCKRVEIIIFLTIYNFVEGRHSNEVSSHEYDNGFHNTLNTFSTGVS